jgi:hypothetical protein
VLAGRVGAGAARMTGVGAGIGWFGFDPLGDPRLTVLKRMFGLLVPRFPTTPALPSACIAAFTWAGVIVGSRSRYKAATPEP